MGMFDWVKHPPEVCPKCGATTDDNWQTKCGFRHMLNCTEEELVADCKRLGVDDEDIYFYNYCDNCGEQIVFEWVESAGRFQLYVPEEDEGVVYEPKKKEEE